jgi:hypothetical protein
MKGRRIVRVLALAARGVANTAGTVIVGVDWMLRRARARATESTTVEGSSILLKADFLDGPDEVEESLVVVSVEARAVSSVGDLDLGAGEFEVWCVSG